MRRNLIPIEVQGKLDKFEREVESLTKRVAKTEGGIAGARERLSGGFQKDEDYNDIRATLDQLVAELPKFQRKLDDAQYVLADCRAFLEDLPDDVTLQPVAPVKPNGADLASVRRRIANAEDEIAQLSAIPVPASDIESRVQEYVNALARPKVTGVATGQRLQVTWPDDVIAVLALLLPDQMTSALVQDVERQSNAPMPLAERKKRIAELKAQVDTLQRAALALGDSNGLPPEVVLGVRVVKREPAKRSAA
jgi:predicted  nucleic acid-binding Zn-ribbon protein